MYIYKVTLYKTLGGKKQDPVERYYASQQDASDYLHYLIEEDVDAKKLLSNKCSSRSYGYDENDEHLLTSFVFDIDLTDQVYAQLDAIWVNPSEKTHNFPVNLDNWDIEWLFGIRNAKPTEWCKTSANGAMADTPMGCRYHIAWGEDNKAKFAIEGLDKMGKYELDFPSKFDVSVEWVMNRIEYFARENNLRYLITEEKDSKELNARVIVVCFFEENPGLLVETYEPMDLNDFDFDGWFYDLFTNGSYNLDYPPMKIDGYNQVMGFLNDGTALQLKWSKKGGNLLSIHVVKLVGCDDDWVKRTQEWLIDHLQGASKQDNFKVKHKLNGEWLDFYFYKQTDR